MKTTFARISSAALALVIATSVCAAQSAGSPEGYVRAGERGARLLNVPSQDGVAIEELVKGTPLAVYGERAGFLEVEMPGGMGVWIYGEYARETEVPGVVEVTGNNLTMRPLPSSSTQSFPLKQKLFRGDRVRVITRADPDKPLAQDWVKVWSPAGTRAWVAANETTAIPAAESPEGLWRAATAAAVAARPALTRPATAKPVDASASTAGKPARDVSAPAASAQQAQARAGVSSTEARTALVHADAVYAEAKIGNSSFEAARAAYEDVIGIAAVRSSEAVAAQTRLDEIAAREEIVRLQGDYARFEGERRAEIASAEAELEAIRIKKDPLWGGRFQARGWIERSARADGSQAHVVRWSGRETAEIVCSSGRYDLATFEQFEVGVVGVTTRGAQPSSIGQAARPLEIDVARIEILSGRRPRR